MGFIRVLGSRSISRGILWFFSRVGLGGVGYLNLIGGYLFQGLSREVGWVVAGKKEISESSNVYVEYVGGLWREYMFVDHINKV